MKAVLKGASLVLFLGFAVLTSGCVTYDGYYNPAVCCGVSPMYDTNGMIIGGYYQSDYQVRGYWPYYSKPYVQRNYYYVW